MPASTARENYYVEEVQSKQKLMDDWYHHQQEEIRLRDENMAIMVAKMDVLMAQLRTSERADDGGISVCKPMGISTHKSSACIGLSPDGRSLPFHNR